MAKQYKLSYLVLTFAVILMSSLLVSCKQPSVPSDADVGRAYHNNYREISVLVKMLLAEGNQKFEVDKGRTVKYLDGSQPPVSSKALDLCQQVMNRTFALSTRKNVGTIELIFFEENTPDHFRSKAIVYDKDSFKDKIWAEQAGSASSSIRYLDLAPPMDAGTTPEDIEAGGNHWKLEYRYEKHKN